MHSCWFAGLCRWFKETVRSDIKLYQVSSSDGQSSPCIRRTASAGADQSRVSDVLILVKLYVLVCSCWLLQWNMT